MQSMNRRTLVSAMVLSLSLVAAQPALAVAAPLPGTTTQTLKLKTIHFNVRNDSGATVTLSAGEMRCTLEPGKTASLKLPEGTALIVVNGTAHIAAGSVVTTVQKGLDGNTLAIS